MATGHDSFWRYFALIVGALAVITTTGAFLGEVFEQAEGVVVDSLVATSAPRIVYTPPEKPVPPFTGVIYKNSLAYGVEDWSWDTATSSAPGGATERSTHALQAVVQKPYGALRLAHARVSPGTYETLEFSVLGTDDITVSLYDAFGNEIGSEPLSWYDTSALDGWRTVRIPLTNLGGLGRSIGGVAWSSAEPVTFTLDDVSYTHTRVEHDPAPPTHTESTAPVLTKSELPYEFAFIEAERLLWHAPVGMFAITEWLDIGSDTKTGSQSLAIHTRGANWTDYSARADVTMRGDSLSLIARYQSESDYIACAFNGRATGVQIYRAKGQRYDLIAESPELPYWNLGPRYTFAVAVHGDKVECSVNNTRILTATLPLAASGTVGIATWNAKPGLYATTVHSFVVTGD